jgi:hypothetical protein
VHRKEGFLAGNFVFRNEQDWKSNKSVEERGSDRINEGPNASFVRAVGVDPRSTFTGLRAQEPYRQKVHSFRDRNKDQ